MMALLPAPPRLPIETSDKVQHAFTFGVLSLLALASFRRTPLVALGLGLSVFGGLIELLQLIPPLHRDSDWMDWLVDSAAVAATLLPAALLRRR
jgi:VanZ family protein